jgi:regulatory protein YycI of two-component signal transduction system YycFG
MSHQIKKETGMNIPWSVWMKADKETRQAWKAQKEAVTRLKEQEIDLKKMQELQKEGIKLQRIQNKWDMAKIKAKTTGSLTPTFDIFSMSI